MEDILQPKTVKTLSSVFIAQAGRPVISSVPPQHMPAQLALWKKALFKIYLYS